MSRRPPFYHPYKSSVPWSPAGFRLRDYVPRRCFDLFEGLGFTDALSFDPTPLSNPIQGAQYLDNNAPPTIRLGDLLASGFSKTSPAPAPEQVPNPNVVPIKNASPRRKNNRGPKHLSFKKDGSRSNIPSHRRSQQFKEKRESLRRTHHGRQLARSRSELSRLCREAHALMSSSRMSNEDRIFLEQLGNLEVEHQMDDALEDWRERMARAARETDQRRKEHKARDAEAAKLWEEKRDKEALEKFVCKEDKQGEAITEGHFRHLEEEAIRTDAERQRAHEAAEREVRLAQEYLHHKELARKVKEEQRRRREKQECQLREKERQRREEIIRRLREARQLREEKERQQWEEMTRRFQEEARQLREEKERQRQEEVMYQLQEHARQLREEREQQQREETMRRYQEEANQLREEVRRLRQAEREHQQRQEQERKLREEVERLRREAHERYLRDERERLAREQQEHQARCRAEEAQRSAMEEQIRQQFVLYEAKWNELRSNNSIPPIDVREMPWPVLGAISSADQITYQDVRAFLFHPQRPGVEGKSARDKVKSEVLRYHPDKFNTRVIPKIQYAHQTVAKDIAGAVARILTTIMNEEAELQK